MKTSTSCEIKVAAHKFTDHDHVHCAECGKLVSGPSQAANQAPWKWARQCSACGVVTWYNVESEALIAHCACHVIPMTECAKLGRR